MDPEARKQAAVDILRMAIAGTTAGLVGSALARDGKHHVPSVPAGIGAFTKAMDNVARENPQGRLEVKHVLCDGDMVAVHSHVVHKSSEPGVATMHLFRFQGDKVAEMWAVGQPVPKDMPNRDGMF